ncbi:MAG: AbrB/MazE/SpoVT family DNA-binding domain-containing protein [Methylococcaceae bacterium]|nr:MAG: AbrB/MazE/SpoVT family DNA-binding domain-containing protein [Methylococcaceae bacterium]
MHLSIANSTPSVRRVRLFKNGSNQALRIPREFELPGQEAVIYQDGDRLIIEPMKKPSLLAVLATLSALDEDFPAIEDAPVVAEDIF